MSAGQEYMDIVNEADEVIGRDTRANVHARHEIHRGVHVFVFNARGELLLQLRSATKASYPGHWDASVGGQVAAGETYLAAARRELAEELGCRADTLELVGRYNSYSARQREKRALFIHRYDGSLHPAADEIEEIRFVAPSAVPTAMRDAPFTEGFRRSFALWSAVTQRV
jgi:isopentenyl-diphosphate delta-isomerase type 1